jgi:hypothetical protein
VRYLFLEEREKQRRRKKLEEMQKTRESLNIYSRSVKQRCSKPIVLGSPVFVPIIKEVKCDYVFYTKFQTITFVGLIEYLKDYHSKLKVGQSVYASDIMQGLIGYGVSLSDNFIAEPDELLYFGSLNLKYI